MNKMADVLQAILSSDSDDSDILTRRPRRIFERNNYYEDYDDDDFRRRFRLSHRSALDILEEIEDGLEFPSDRNNVVSPINQLLLTLRYYATGSFLLPLADYIGVSKATAHRIVHRVSRAIASLRTKYICFPHTEQHIAETVLANYNVASFPKVLGLMDCTHIKIQSPGGSHAELFRNRKGYFSLNVQAICNANLEFMDIVARWPGSAHDSTIFNSCRKRAEFENGIYGDYMLLGDSGYPLRRYLMTPLDRPITRADQLYNESHIRTRNCIERMFGVWKRRFPVLALGIPMQLKNIFAIIVATAVLHNILRQKGDVVPPDDPTIILPMPWEELLQRSHLPSQRPGRREQSGDLMRRAILTNYFQRLRPIAEPHM